MLVLVEPLNEHLLDRPDLGIAMLIASCRTRGIATSLVKGQTRILNDIFMHDSKELWHLICDLGLEDLKKLGIFKYKKLIHEKGLRQIFAELEREYNEIIINKSLRHYFNVLLLHGFENRYITFLKVYHYYLNTLHCDALKIIDRYIAEIKKNRPRYIGFSFNKYPEPFLLHIVKRIKEETEVPIIAGGNFTRFISSSETEKLFLENYFDYLVVGPAEYALPRLIETLDDGKEPESIPNVCYRKNGKVKFNTLKAIDDLDALPYPDFSVFDLDLYLAPKRILPLQTARGCFWGKCAFCDYHINYAGTYKTFSIRRVIECIKYLRNTYDCQHIMFHDESLSAKRVVLISKALIKNQIRHQFFYAYARFEKEFVNSKTLSLMRKAGFVVMFWGLESGCQRVLNLMNKGIRISYVHKILKQTSRHNIANLCMGFFGFPGERKEEAKKTVEFLRRNAKYIDLVELQPLGISPFSAIARNPHKWGLKVNSNGTYSVQNGMDFQEVRSFFNILMTKVDANTLKLTSNELRLISDFRSAGYYRYILSALSRRLGIMTHQKIRRLIKENKVHRVYPVIPGMIGNQNRKIIFSPVRINESVFINIVYPYKKIFLTPFEKAIISFADGTLSLEDIMNKVHERFGNGNKKVDIYKKCRKFFHEIFSKELGIAFRRQY